MNIFLVPSKPLLCPWYSNHRQLQLQIACIFLWRPSLFWCTMNQLWLISTSSYVCVVVWLMKLDTCFQLALRWISTLRLISTILICARHVQGKISIVRGLVINVDRIFSMVSNAMGHLQEPQMEWSRIRTWRVQCSNYFSGLVHAFHQWHVSTTASLPMKSISWYLSGNCGSLYLLHLESFSESKRRKNHWSKLTLFLSLSRFHLYFFIHQNSEVKIWIMFFQCLISMFAWPYITIMTHVSLLCTAQYQSMKNEIEMLKMVSLKLPKSRSSSYFHVGPTEPDPSEPTWQMLDMAKLSLGGNSVPLKNGFKS